MTVIFKNDRIFEGKLIMSKIAIVTDSNSGINQIQAKEMGITVIPMPFTAGDKTYLEDISINQEQFYELLDQNINVSTSQPPIGEVIELWDKLLKEYDEVVHIPMSSGLSMAYDTAAIFASEKPYEGRVHVVNNMRISVTQRRSVFDALSLVSKGKTGTEIKHILEKNALESSIYIIVDDLKYLKKGGRITPAAAAFGALLGIKPVLQIQGKKLDAFKKARGIKMAKVSMLEAAKNDIINRFGGEENVYIDIAHTNNLEEANKFLQEVKKIFPNAIDNYMDSLSLSVSCHIGPGSLAIAISKKLDI